MFYYSAVADSCIAFSMLKIVWIIFFVGIFNCKLKIQNETQKKKKILKQLMHNQKWGLIYTVVARKVERIIFCVQKKMYTKENKKTIGSKKN